MSDELVTVQTFGTAHEAEFARGLLESSGIPVFLADQNVARLEVNALVGWVKLQVKESDAADAREILATAGDPTDEEDNPE